MFRVLSRFSLLLIILATLASPTQLIYASPDRLQQPAQQNIFIPVVHKVYAPPIPNLYSIENGDFDNQYTITWEPLSDLYNSVLPVSVDITIEEADNPGFANSVTYQAEGSAGEWVATPKTPGTYYYRARATVASYIGEWSQTQIVTIYPLFVGLHVRWDGLGHIKGSRPYSVNVYYEWNANGITEGDTIRIKSRQWFFPDLFEDQEINRFYSARTGEYRSSSSVDDPSWKWGHRSFLPYQWQLSNGEQVSINGQKFNVSGPHSGYTSYGQSIQYWKLVNDDEFLMYDDGDIEQRVHKSDAILHYDAGNSRLLIYSNICRHIYDGDEETGDTVQYITQLTSSNSMPSNTVSAQSTDMPSAELPSAPEIQATETLTGLLPAYGYQH